MIRNTFTLSKKIVLIEKISKIKGHILSFNTKSTKPFLLSFDGNTSIDFEITDKESKNE